MTVLSILATIFGILMALSNFPQAYKIFRRKNAKDISFITYVILLIGTLIWLFYGIELNIFPIIISNTIGTIGVLFVMAGYFLYGKENRKS